MPRQRIVAPLIVLSTLFMPACDDRGPTAPSRVRSSVASPAPPPNSDLASLVGVWNLTVRLRAVTGSGGVADTMRSRIAEATFG
jgi:hypothetical protein